jgi:hypothetical protein
MPFLILHKGDKACPCAVCDHCGEEISLGKDGNALWSEDWTDKAHPRIEPVKLTH